MSSDTGIKNIKADLLVIGAGPAGLTAALYGARAGQKTVVLEGRASSRLDIGYELENYPGFISITSKELLNKFREHARHFGAEIIKSDVIEMSLATEPKYVSTTDFFIEARVVILATGKPMPKERLIPGEESLVGMGVSYCATCDGPLYRGITVAGVGNSDEAAEDVLALHQMGCRVLWISGERKDWKASESLLDEVREKNIPIYPRAVVKEITGSQKVEKIVIEKEGKKEEIDVAGVFIFRDIPTAPMFTRAGITLDHRQCVTTDRTQKTSLEGVFVAGDVTCGGMQVVSAAGEGCVAALEAVKYLRKK